MRYSLHGKQIPFSQYEAAAAVLVALCWGEEDLQQLLTAVFNADKAVEIMIDENPREAALFELYGQIEFGVDLVSELSAVNVRAPEPYSTEAEHLTHLTGLIAQGLIGGAISWCCEKIGCLDPAVDYYTE